jgi:hypothetical protein
MSTSLFKRAALTLTAAAVLAFPVALAATASAHTVPPLKPAVTAVQLKDGRALDLQYAMKYDSRLHRWVSVATGKVIADRYEGRRDYNRSQDFRLAYGPAGKMAFIQYIGSGIPPSANYGYVGSKLVRSSLDATIFTVSAPGPLGFRTMTVPAAFGPKAHGPEILTGEIFGQLGLNGVKPFALPTSAQLFAERLVIPAHR